MVNYHSNRFKFCDFIEYVHLSDGISEIIQFSQDVNAKYYSRYAGKENYNGEAYVNCSD